MKTTTAATTIEYKLPATPHIWIGRDGTQRIRLEGFGLPCRNCQEVGTHSRSCTGEQRR